MHTNVMTPPNKWSARSRERHILNTQQTQLTSMP